jgi:hypothetical protein
MPALASKRCNDRLALHICKRASAIANERLPWRGRIDNRRGKLTTQGQFFVIARPLIIMFESKVGMRRRVSMQHGNQSRNVIATLDKRGYSNDSRCPPFRDACCGRNRTGLRWISPDGRKETCVHRAVNIVTRCLPRPLSQTTHNCFHRVGCFVYVLKHQRATLCQVNRRQGAWPSEQLGHGVGLTNVKVEQRPLTSACVEPLR